MHLDQHYWKPGWAETPKDEWRRVQAELVAGHRWIVDGNYGGTLDVRFERVDVTFLWWIWRYRHDSRPRLDQALDRHGDHLTIIELRSRRQANDFLQRTASTGH